ncbi:MAG: response regulator [Anaerolineae bacterium]|nr:response regulator [Anaerolineae bacterium]
MPTVMIVDDSAFIRNRVIKWLTQAGYNTLVACDGIEAVQLYKENRPDAVLMDITLPRKSGLDALNEIHQHDAQAKVIMLTALDQSLIAGRAILYGAKEFLTKPVDAEQILKALKKVLR